MTLEQFLGFLAQIIKWAFILGLGWFVIVATIAAVSWFAGRKDRREFRARFKQQQKEFDEAWDRRRR
jgi:hypothetical protein